MAKNAGRFVKKDSVERYARRYGADVTKKRFGDSAYSSGMRRGKTPGAASASKGSGVSSRRGSNSSPSAGGASSRDININLNKKKGSPLPKWIVSGLLFFSLLGVIVFAVNGLFLPTIISLAVFLISLFFITTGTKYQGTFKVAVVSLVVLLVLFVPTTVWGQDNVVPLVSDAQNRISDLGFLGFLKDILNPSDIRDYGDFENELYEEEGIGVSLDYPSTKKDRYDPGQSIVIYSYLEAGTLSEYDSDINFECELDGYVEDYEAKPESIVLPSRGDIVSQRVECRFLEGLKEERTQTRDAKIIAKFDEFYSEATYPLLFVYEDDERDIKPAGYVEDSIKWYNIRGFGNSQVSPGPVKLALGIEAPQPFKAGVTDLNLEIRIESDSRVNLDRVESLQLFIPRDSIIMHTDDQFCDFEMVGGDARYDIFEVKMEVQEDYLNKQCTTTSCYREKKLIQLSCFFDINSGFISEGEVLQDTIGANMKYSFDISRTTTVTVRPLSDEDLEAIA
jgi:hypothetical protein